MSSNSFDCFVALIINGKIIKEVSTGQSTYLPKQLKNYFVVLFP